MKDWTPILQWRGISKAFGEKPILKGLDLWATEGTSLVIMGGSGEGKSVTLKLALGLMRPDSGQVLFRGKPLTAGPFGSQAKLYKQSGVLFQGAALLDSLSVWENVAFRLLNADRISRKVARRRAIEALDQVRLPATVADLYPSELSGGMLKRVGLARAIVAKPAILFLDEPTTGLDPVTAEAINLLIVDLVRGMGCTAVTITHDLVSARTIADEIAMLEGGQVIWGGPVTAMLDSEHPTVQRFLRSGGFNRPARPQG